MLEPTLDELIEQLALYFDELREQGRLQQRGGERIRDRGAGAKDKLTTADGVLATVLYLRKPGAGDLLAQLFGVNGSTLTRAVHQVQLLLAEHGHTIPPSTARFSTPTDVTAFLANAVQVTSDKTSCSSPGWPRCVEAGTVDPAGSGGDVRRRRRIHVWVLQAAAARLGVHRYGPRTTCCVGRCLRACRVVAQATALAGLTAGFSVAARASGS